MVWEELSEDLIFTDLDKETTDGIFVKMGGELIERGFAKESYVRALMEREEEYPTGLNINGFGVAIPHTPVEHVNETATAIGVLRKPVTFVEMGSEDDEVDVSLVFMLCVTDPHAHIDQLGRIVVIIQDNEVLEKLRATNDPAEIISIIREKEETL